MQTIVITGRINVGKSTLFNKLIEQRKALVSKIPGTTRDLNYGICEWGGQKFQVVDTGGIFETKILKYKNTRTKEQLTASGSIFSKRQYREKIIEFQIEIRTREILNKADLVLFLVDAGNGILKNDRLIAQLIKKNKKPYILVVNKIDKRNAIQAEEFKKLGLGDGIPISATSGRGVGDLLDKIIKTLKHPSTPSFGTRAQCREVRTSKNIKTKEKTEYEEIISKNGQIRVCILGKPNVGKSSILNQVLGEEKVIVSPIPHTTREPQNTIIEFKNNKIELIDTAGIRRKSKVKLSSLESAGIAMSIKALKKSDISLFVIDISEKLSSQDAQLASLIIEPGVSVIIVCNKYDLIKTVRTGQYIVLTVKKLTNYIHDRFPFLTWAPIIFTSGLTGRNCQKILPLILEVKKAREKQIDNEELNEFLKYLFKKMPPPRQFRSSGGRKSRAFISKITQIKSNRPIFEINVTNITEITESYLRYLENNIRKRFKFIGTPIEIKVIRTKK